VATPSRIHSQEWVEVQEEVQAELEDLDLVAEVVPVEFQ